MHDGYLHYDSYMKKCSQQSTFDQQNGPTPTHLQKNITAAMQYMLD